MTELVLVRARTKPEKFSSPIKEDISRTYVLQVIHIESSVSGWTLLGALLSFSPELPFPDEWGWIRSEMSLWLPVWTKLPQASKVSQELLR